MATLAFFIAVGGASAFATTQLAKNTVGTKQLKNGAVTQAKISKSAQLALKGQKGDPGTNGTNGTDGKSAITHIVIRQGSSEGIAFAECKPGELVTGGGASDESGGALKTSHPNIQVDESMSNGRWTAEAVNPTDTVSVRIICASP